MAFSFSFTIGGTSGSNLDVRSHVIKRSVCGIPLARVLVPCECQRDQRLSSSICLCAVIGRWSHFRTLHYLYVVLHVLVFGGK